MSPITLEPPHALAAVLDADLLAGGQRGPTVLTAATARILDAARSPALPPGCIVVAVGFRDAKNREAAIVRAVPRDGFLRSARRAAPAIGSDFVAPDAGAYRITGARPLIERARRLAMQADADPAAVRRLFSIIGVAATRLGFLSSLDDRTALIAAVDAAEGWLPQISIVVAPAPRDGRA